MEMSVREARAQFAHALAAAERGERVTITKNGKPVAELGPPSMRKNSFTWERLEEWRRANGFDKMPVDKRSTEEWFRDYDSIEIEGMSDPAIFPDE